MNTPEQPVSAPPSEADRSLAETARIIAENYHNTLLETLRRQTATYEPPAQ